MLEPFRTSARSALVSVRRRARAAWSGIWSWPGLRALRGRQLRRLQPFGGGRENGEPVIRAYWEEFLTAHRGDLRGVALEIGGTLTLRRHGGPALSRLDALDVAARPGISVVADLSRADALDDAVYDCFVVPFTMHLIYDLDAALYHAIRILKPGGVLLVTFPCVDYYFEHGLDMGTGRPLFVFWWFTPLQVENLLRRAGLPPAAFQLTVYGNLLTRIAYQVNLPAEELTAAEYNHRDAGHPLLVCARIVKPVDWAAPRPAYCEPWVPSGAPAKWNTVTGHYPPQ